MEIAFTSDVQAHILKLALETGQTPERVVEKIVSEQLLYEEWFRASVAQGFASLDAGASFTQEEAEARAAKVLGD